MAAAEGSFRFRREERLKSRAEITAVFKKGRSFASAGAKLFILPNDRGYNRLAVTFSRKFGDAVRRNRARRLSREVYRLNKSRLRPGFDLVLLVYPGKDEFQARLAQFNTLSHRAGLLMERNNGD
ncbi:hypothetical protein FACS1894147_08840 [Spirochaetia bacterium]|nr:hypothetical protein FACS1894147_08840 [Spirochaetia bacterium]